MRARRRFVLLVVAGLVGLPPALLRTTPASAATSTTYLASILPDGQQPPYGATCCEPARFSADNRYVLFSAEYEDNGVYVFDQLFRRDLVDGVTETVSKNPTTGAYANSSPWSRRMSRDGRYVVWNTSATNLGPTDASSNSDVYWRDMVTGEIKLVSVRDDGTQGPWFNNDPDVSADGRYVFFVTLSTLTADDTNNADDVYRRDTVTNTTQRVNFGAGGTQAVFDSYEPAISGNGRYLAFGSWADNLVANDLNNKNDIFVRDLQTGDVEMVSVTSSEAQGTGLVWEPSISDDGNVVSWMSSSGSYVADDTNGTWDIFVRNRSAGTTVRASLSATGEQITGPGAYATDPVMSADGRYVAFDGYGDLLSPGKTTPFDEVFVKDMQTGQLARVALANGTGDEANSDSYYPGISPDGTRVGFISDADNLVASDGNDNDDIFVHELIPEDFITRPPSELFGRLRSSGYANDPVNTASGNFTTTETDLDFPDAVFGMDWHRTYNSRDERFSVLGTGWTPAAGAHLDEDPEGNVTLTDRDGRTVTFVPEGAGYSRPEEVYADLAKHADGTFTLASFDGSAEQFSSEGTLTAWQNWDGQSVAYGYVDGRLTTVTNSTGRSLALTYDAAGARITKVQADDGRQAEYGYSAGGDLVTVTRTDGGTVTYTLDDLGRITQILDADGVLVIGNAYDVKGRVTSQETSSGNTVGFAYDDATGRTTVTDQATGGQTVFVHDPDGHLVGVVDAEGESLSKEYDGDGNLVAVTDRRGAATTQTFDGHGNLLSRSGEEGVTETFTYDALDRPVTHTNGESETTTLSYEGSERLPSTVTDAEGGTTTFDVQSGLVASATDADGVTVTYAHNGKRELTAMTDENGKSTTFTYDAAGNEASRRTPLGRTTYFTYDGRRRPLTVKDPTGAIVTSTWTPGDRLATEKDAENHTTTYAYDTAGRISSVTDPLSHTVTFGYDADGNVTSVTKPGGATSTATYDAMGRRLSDTDPTGVTTTYGYDADGNPTTTTDENGHSVTRAYDLRGRVTTVTDQLGHVSTRTWDKADRLLSLAAPAAGTTTYSYDDAGRLLSTTDGIGSTSSMSYSAAGRTVSRTDPNGHATSYAYDAVGRLVTVIDAEAGVTTSTYDDDGRLVQHRSAEGLFTNYTYDSAGRVTLVKDPSGGEAHRSYTPSGRVATLDPPGQGRRQFTYDDAGRLTKAIDGTESGNPSPIWFTAFTYDGRGNLLTRRDAAGGFEQFTYDAADRLSTWADQLNRTTTYSYDNLGRLTSVADPSGRSEGRTYDPASRILTRTYGDGSTTGYVYDAAGRRTELDDATGTSDFSYDAAGRLLSTTFPTGRQVANGYDPAGNRTSITYPDGSVASLAYDDVNRLVSLSHPSAGTVGYTYDDDGRLTSETAPGVVRAWSWALGRLASYTESSGLTTRQTTLGYGDGGSRVDFETTDGVTTTYDYDGSGQLRKATETVGPAVAPITRASRRYVFGSNADRATTTETTPTSTLERSWSRDQAHQVLSISEPFTSYQDLTHLSYDGAGRLTTITSPPVDQATTYDAKGRPSSVSTTYRKTLATRTWQTERTHDGDGTLVGVSTTAPDGTVKATELTWDLAAQVPQVLTMSSGGADTNLLYGLGRSMAVRQGQANTFSRDVRGSALTNSGTADLVAAPRYDEFGKPVRSAVQQQTNALGLTDEARDHSVRLGYRGELHIDGRVHLRAREYMPALGRFTTKDPFQSAPGEATLGNPYPYAANDPVNLVDPLGLSPVGDGDLQWDPNVGLENYLAGMRALSIREQLARAIAATNATIAAANEMKLLVQDFFRTQHEQNMAARRGSSAGFSDYWDAFKDSTYNVGRALWDTANGIAELLRNPSQFVDNLQAAYKELGLLGAVNQFNPAYHMLVSGNAYIDALRSGNYDQASYYATQLVMDAAGTITAATALKSALTRAYKSADEAAGVADEVLCSFTPGTVIVMSDGTTKAIKDVRVGDEVATAEPGTTESEAGRTVTAVHEHVDNGLVDVTVVDQSGTRGTINTTARHPFWDGTAGIWVAAGRLQVGHELQTVDGSLVRVHAVTSASGSTTVYNLTVAERHTFFVASGASTALVHNTCDRMLGVNGTQVTSVTLHTSKRFHIDVENPAPGVRPGQLHLQDYSGNKYLYDFKTEAFEGLPRSLAKEAAGDPGVARAISKAKTYLGVD